MRVGILGPLEVEADGRLAPVAGARLRTLLIRLALDPGRAVSTQSLSQALWDSEPPRDPEHALHALVSRLRRALPESRALRSTPGGYRLDVPPERVDAIHFERLVQRGRWAMRESEQRTAAALLREALGLWRGEPLVDAAAASFAAPAAARLTELRLTATEDWIAAELAVSADHRPLMAKLRELVAAYPLRERLRLLLVQAAHQSGRNAEALTAFAEYRSLLAEELGADPGPEIQAAHLAVLRGERPRPAPPARRRGNLRAPLSTFVGREQERERVSHGLREGRLVTLTGPGGVGKSRLATTVAEELREHYPGGAWLVELAPVTAAEAVGQAVAAALGLAGEGLSGLAASADPVSRVAEAFAATPALIVLDNCEHLVDAAARAAVELLGRCPLLAVLATSREPLGVPGETLCPVSPLDLPADGAPAAEAATSLAVRLFADRAAASAPGFAVDDTNIALVVEVCRRLDGLPLAIELAAARLRSLPLAELAARLGDRLGLLAVGPRAAQPRHQTLAAVVGWSWDLLSGAEQALAARVAVFAGGVTPESAAALLGPEARDGAPAIDLLAGLA